MLPTCVPQSPGLMEEHFRSVQFSHPGIRRGTSFLWLPVTLLALQHCLCLPRFASSFFTVLPDNIFVSRAFQRFYWFLCSQVHPVTPPQKLTSYKSIRAQVANPLLCRLACLANSQLILPIRTFSLLTALSSPVSTFLSDALIKGHGLLEYVYRCFSLLGLQ